MKPPLPRRPAQWRLEDTALQLGPEMPDQPLDRPGRGVAERADGVPLDLARHLLKVIDLLDPRLAPDQAFHDPPHPAGALAAGRALAAAFVHVKVRKTRDRRDDVGTLVHDDE